MSARVTVVGAGLGGLITSLLVGADGALFAVAPGKGFSGTESQMVSCTPMSRGRTRARRLAIQTAGLQIPGAVEGLALW
jgi:hypothetical protein